MDTDEGDRGREVSVLDQRSAALWGQIQVARAPRGLGGLARRLAQAHRRLARLDAGLPQTATSQRFRRRCLEEVQSQRVELEALLAGLVASTAELSALADRQRERSGASPGFASPVLKARTWTDAPRLLEVSAVLGVLAVIAFSRWPLVFFPVAAFIWMLVRDSPGPRLEFQFDGRTLRVVRRLFGIQYASTSVDLARVDEVVVTGFMAAHTRLAVRTPEGVVVLGTHPTGRDSELLTAQLREWWLSTATQHC